MPSPVSRCKCLAVPRGAFRVWLQQFSWAGLSWGGTGRWRDHQQLQGSFTGCLWHIPDPCAGLAGSGVATSELAECWICRAGVAAPSWDLWSSLHRISSTLCSHQEQPHVLPLLLQLGAGVVSSLTNEVPQLMRNSFLQHCELKSASCRDLCGPHKLLPLRAVGSSSSSLVWPLFLIRFPFWILVHFSLIFESLQHLYPHFLAVFAQSLSSDFFCWQEHIWFCPE